MQQEIKDNRFVFTVLKLLEPMGDTECRELDHQILGLSKNNTLFGLIVGKELYLRINKEGVEERYTPEFEFREHKYCKLGKNFLNHQDTFLQIVTKSYWLAASHRSDCTDKYI